MTARLLELPARGADRERAGARWVGAPGAVTRQVSEVPEGAPKSAEPGQELRWRGTPDRMLLAKGCAPLSRLGWYPQTPPSLDYPEAFRALGRHPTLQAELSGHSTAGRRVGIPPRQGEQEHAPWERRV